MVLTLLFPHMLLQRFQHLVDMSGNSYAAPLLQQPAFLINEKGGANNSFILASVQLFELPYPELTTDTMILI
ncbi:hypothetical protein D3C77_787390 [compost metagenome]